MSTTTTNAEPIPCPSDLECFITRLRNDTEVFGWRDRFSKGQRAFLQMHEWSLLAYALGHAMFLGEDVYLNELAAKQSSEVQKDRLMANSCWIILRRFKEARHEFIQWAGDSRLYLHSIPSWNCFALTLKAIRITEQKFPVESKPNPKIYCVFSREIRPEKLRVITIASTEYDTITATERVDALTHKFVVAGAFLPVLYSFMVIGNMERYLKAALTELIGPTIDANNKEQCTEILRNALEQSERLRAVIHMINYATYFIYHFNTLRDHTISYTNAAPRVKQEPVDED